MRRLEERGSAARRPGPARVSAGGGGRGAPRADGKELRRAGRAARRSGRAGRAAVGAGSRGAGARRRRAGLAPDLTFWVRACVQEARRGRGWGREAGREVPGWLASAPSSLPHLPAPEGTGPQGPRREAGGALPAGSRRSRPGPGDTALSGLWGLLGEGAGGRRGALTLPTPRPSGESRRRLFRDRGWVGPWLAGPSLFPPPPSGFRGLRDRGAGIRDPSVLHRLGAGPGLKPSGFVTRRGNFPKPGTEPEHPPPSPRPLIPLPLHLLHCLPLPPTRISQRVTDGAVSQSKAGN